MRNRLFQFGLLVLVLAVAFSGPALAAKKKKVDMEGTWNVKVTPDAATAASGEKEFDDSLVLHKGKFRSSAGEPKGFEQASYRLEENHWMADATSREEGRRHWHGEVTGDSVEGQMTWTRPNGAVLNYTFTGSRVAKQPQNRKSGE